MYLTCSGAIKPMENRISTVLKEQVFLLKQYEKPLPRKLIKTLELVKQNIKTVCSLATFFYHKPYNTQLSVCLSQVIDSSKE
jgi:hypothetical protein